MRKFLGHFNKVSNFNVSIDHFVVCATSLIPFGGVRREKEVEIGDKSLVSFGLDLFVHAVRNFEVMN